jgi:hypothetical protein
MIVTAIAGVVGEVGSSLAQQVDQATKFNEVQQASSDLLQHTEQTSVKTWQLVKAGLESDEVKAAQHETFNNLSSL